MASRLAITAAPCAKCPFRTDVPIYRHRRRDLRPVRRLGHLSVNPA